MADIVIMVMNTQVLKILRFFFRLSDELLILKKDFVSKGVNYLGKKLKKTIELIS